MSLSKEELAKYIHNPNMVIKTMLDFIERGTKENLTIGDPTNPFMMLMEASAVSGSNALLEPMGMIRKLYPNLAETPNDLYHHVSDEELVNLFAVPSVATIVIYINVLDLRSNGIKNIKEGYTETKIPKYTEIIVGGVTFTLLNDILVRLYDEGSVFVEQLTDKNEMAINDLGVLSSGIINDKEGIPWLIFETKIKQVTKKTINKTIVTSQGFNATLPLTSKYYTSVISYKNQYTNGEYEILPKSHNESYINPRVPTAYISLKDDGVDFRIPDVYLLDGLVSGNVKIDMYQTHGKLTLPIDKYSNTEFTIKLPTDSRDELSATINNIVLQASARIGVDGGRNSLSLEELKDSIIHSSTGNINLPITDKNIKTLAGYNGFEIFKALDIITDRVYIASKNTTNLDSNLIYARPDIFFNTTNIILAEVKNNPNVIIKDDVFVIRSGTIFEERNNKVFVADSRELDNILVSTIDDQLEFFNNRNFFCTPYYYVMDKTDDKLTSRIYNLDAPHIDNIKIAGKNVNIFERVNSDMYGISSDRSGYKLLVSLKSNDKFNELDPKSINGELIIPLHDGSSNVHIHGTYDQKTNIITFEIDTSFYVDNDDMITIDNGISLITNTKTKLKNNVYLYIYTTDTNVIDETNYMNDEIYTTDSTHVVVFVKETFDISFGDRLDFIWNKMYSTFTSRKYKKHKDNKYLTYKEDVYKIFPETGSIFKKDNDGNLVKELLHSKGDYILDPNGDRIYEYKAGDLIKDDRGLPIIDNDIGVMRNIDIMMLEYNFRRSDNKAYRNHLKSILSTINVWLLESIPEINDKLIENTEVLYKSYKSTSMVPIKVNNVIVNLPYRVKPEVTLYVSKHLYTTEEMSEMKDIIGKILHNHLDQTLIKLDNIKKDIISKFGNNIVGVKIEGIDNGMNIESFEIQDKTKRLTLKKKILTNSSNEVIVKYDLELNTIMV